MKEGDFLEIDFIGKVEATGEVFDMTVEEEAKKRGLKLHEGLYKPQLVIIGSGMVVPGVEEELEKMEVGQEKQFVVQPGKAFGQRDPANIKIIPLTSFHNQKVDPVPGDFVEIDSRRAKVQSASSGRVRVDFNHPLAGKALSYWMKIVSQVTGTKEKAAKLLDYYSLKCAAEVTETKLTIKTEQEVPKQLQELLVAPIKKWIPEIKEIVFAAKAKETAGKENQAAAPAGENKGQATGTASDNLKVTSEPEGKL